MQKDYHFKYEWKWNAFEKFQRKIQSESCLLSTSSPWQISHEYSMNRRERSGSVVEYLTGDQGAAGSNLTGVTALWSLSKTHLS